MAYAALADAKAEEDRAALVQAPVRLLGISVKDGIEICADEGDLIIFNPTCVHSASRNISSAPRYVYFTSYYHPSAEWLNRWLRERNYRDHFPDSLRDGLPSDLRFLLDD